MVFSATLWHVRRGAVTPTDQGRRIEEVLGGKDLGLEREMCWCMVSHHCFRVVGVAVIRA